MSDCISTEFPIWGLLPKKETGVTQFLSKFPEYDGRDVVIAIFDSGVDPAAPGLSITTHGKVKVIERYDCTGAGDVDTSTTATVAADGTIKGLTGRTLRIPDTWKNPTKVYHIGVKNSFDLYTGRLLDRIKKERKEKQWDPQQARALAAASRKAEIGNGKGDSLTGLDKLKKEEKDWELEQLTALEKSFCDLGPVYDCVVFHDGTTWRACIDTSETGDLAAGVCLGEYTLTNEHAPLTENDQLTISINVYDEGNVLEIVSMCSPHGTHVASIAAAHFPHEPEKNGVAPGAQIVSFTIGDARLTSMETGTGLVRAMIKIMQRPKEKPIHVINMSYGEHSNFATAGRIGELMAQVVDKYKVTWISSAGNHGPALSTLTTPPDIAADVIIGVGAYVSPEMMAAEYAMMDKAPGTAYTWSSRGPTMDGGMGVSICAPGGAITSVPNFTLRSSQLMNGTSMASPHVAGAVSLLISGMLSKGLKYSPYSVRRAVENTALYVSDMDPFAQGHGLLQVEKAFDHLCEFHLVLERDVRFLVKVGSQNGKGLYFRNGLLDKAKELPVTVDPLFHEKTPKSEMIAFDLHLNLVCSESWVQVANHLNVTNVTRALNFRINPEGLSEGVHMTCIRAYDAKGPTKGPVFRIPVTVVKPTVLPDGISSLTQRSVVFKPNTIKRHFILVPDRCSWGSITLRSTEKEKTGKFNIHCVQLLPRQACRKLEMTKLFMLNSNAEATYYFKCRGGIIIEIAIAKYWTSVSSVELDYTIDFRGVKPDRQTFVVHGGEGIQSLELYSGLSNEEVAPSISLKQSVMVLRPSESKLTACCADRDVIPPARQIYQQILSYNFSLPKGAEVTPSCMLLNDLLYENEFESQMWMLFDSNKQLLASGDCYPEKYSAKLEKGDYVIRLQIRHEKRDALEKLSETPILVKQKICNPISFDIYCSQTQALLQGKKMTSAILPPGHFILPLYVHLNGQEKNMKSAPQGHYYVGTITYTKVDQAKAVDSYEFKYFLPEASRKKDAGKEKESKKEDYEESLKDFYTGALAKMESGDKANELYEKLLAYYPGHLAVQIAMLSSLDPIDYKRLGVLPFWNHQDGQNEDISELIAISQRVIELADVIIDAIDTAELLANLGQKNETLTDTPKAKMAIEKQKRYLIKALAWKGCALARLKAVNAPLSGSENLVEQIDSIWRELMKFIDVSDLKGFKIGYRYQEMTMHFLAWHAAVHGHYARLLRFLNKLSEEKTSKELDKTIIETYKKLNWTHAAEFLKNQMPCRYPDQYRPF